MTTIKEVAATTEAAAVAVMVFSKIEGAAMTHDHAQVGMHVRKQLNVVEKQSDCDSTKGTFTRSGYSKGPPT